MQVMKWTKDGWTRTKKNIPIMLDHNGRECTPLRRRISEVKEDFHSVSNNPELNEVHLAEEEIMFGTAQDCLDKMTNMTKLVHQDPYTWFFGGNKLFKAIDPEVTAKTAEFNDPEDRWKDSSFYEGVSLATTLYLEESLILGPHPTRDFDVLDIFNNKDDFQLVGAMIQADISVEQIGQEDVIREEDIEDEFIEYEDEVDNLSYCKLDTYIPSFPTLVNDKVDELVYSYNNKTQNLSSEEKAIVYRETAKKIDKLIFTYLVNGFSTCTRYGRFSPPRQQYEQVFNVPDSNWKEVADKRKDKFDETISIILATKNKDQLYGEIRFRDDGSAYREGGYFAGLMKYYADDKALIEKWNNDAFERDREEYISILREKRVDEESIRIKVMAAYDRIAEKKKAEFDDETGVLISESSEKKDSFWRQNRSKAMQFLHFTSNQWAKIFAAKKLMDYRFTLNAKNESEQKWTTSIYNGFSKIETIKDLTIFKEWLTRRDNPSYVINTGKKNIVLGRAPIDNLTIPEQIKLEEAINRVKEALLEQLKQSYRISGEIEEVELPEIKVTCYHCNAEVFQSPNFLKTEGENGYLQIICENCNQSVFLRDNFRIQEKSFTDWIKYILEESKEK